MNRRVRKKIFPFIAVIGDLRCEGFVPADDEISPEEDPDYYDNFITLLIYVSSYLTYDVKSKNLLDAVDILFKIYKVLKIEFAPKCKNIWSFFQEFIYEVDEQVGSNYVQVLKFVKENLMQLLNDLKKHISEGEDEDEEDNEEQESEEDVDMEIE